MLRRTIAAVLVAGVLGANASEAPALTFTRHPWLNLQTPTSILIAWQTDSSATGTVLYGPAPVTDWNLAIAVPHAGVELDHAVSLTYLQPGTAYDYKVVSVATTEITLDAGTFRTAPAQPTPFRFVVFGDIGRVTTEQRQIAARVDTLNADFAILTGDIIYDNGEPENFTPQYFDIYQKTLERIPFYPCLGNHDRYQNNGAGYVNTFYLPENYPAAPERCYSFDYGNAHFVAIEVTYEDTTPNATMLSWLDADLAASTKTWKFVFFHVPMYSNLGTHGDDPTIAAALDPIFRSRKVDLVLQGHNHFYTRTYPIAAGAVVDDAQDPNYLNPVGTIYVVTGGGGRSLYGLEPWTEREAFSKSTYHTTVIDVDGDLLTLRAIERDGTVFDTMTLRKTTPTAIELAEFGAEGDPAGVRLHWLASGTAASSAFNVYRVLGSANPVRLNAQPILGGPSFEYLDTTAEPGITYLYRLGILEDGAERATGWIQGTAGAPYRFAIDRTKPNPTGGPSSISFTLSQRSNARLRIVDVRGHAVRTLEMGQLNVGPHQTTWDGRDNHGRQVASGRYYVVLSAGSSEVRTPITMVR